MYHQTSFLTKRFAALRAVVLLNSVMGLLMVPKATTAGKSLWALVTRLQILHRQKFEPFPRPLGWLLNIEQKWGHSNESLSLSQYGYCTSLFDTLSRNLIVLLTHWGCWSWLVVFRWHKSDSYCQPYPHWETRTVWFDIVFNEVFCRHLDEINYMINTAR